MGLLLAYKQKVLTMVWKEDIAEEYGEQSHASFCYYVWWW